MNRKKIGETLEKQLELLSERSVGLPISDSDGLARLTDAMCNLVNHMAIVGCGRD